VIGPIAEAGRLGRQQQGSHAALPASCPTAAIVPRCRYDDSSEATLLSQSAAEQQQGSRAARAWSPLDGRSNARPTWLAYSVGPGSHCGAC
jgi:hypothetical protein